MQRVFCVTILGSIEEQTILGEANRKDSLSLNLEYVNLNISRTRKLEVKANKSSTEKCNIVRFSSKYCNHIVGNTRIAKMQKFD